jgi:15,16-dihydrobiliverdin:ferredoxin oxidoreductase
MPYSTARIVIGAAMLLQVDAFHSVTSAPSFVRARSTLQQQRDSSIDYTVRYNLEQFIAQEASTTVLSVEEAASRHGMPWKTSMDPTAFVNEELLYMPFWEWQLSFLQENLTDLKVVSCTNGKTDFTYNENTAKKSRIVNLCLSSAEYRKIRLTYYDAGDTTQVYNAVLYPDPAFNLPVLGIDFLAFNRKKYLAICDFQPLHTVESDHDAEFSHLLRPIKESYSNLSGRMSSKFYDETQFFSQQMLFSRFEDESIIQNELFPAFQQYCQQHLALIRACQGKPSSDTMAVLERQQAYDTYSAARDPATGLFTAMFGQEWAMDYVHDFLFSMSQRPAPGTPIVMPTMGGGNPQATAASSKPRSGGNPFATAPALTTQPQVAMAAR